MSIDLIKTLRQRTNAGFVDCKKALGEANNDIEQAIRILRESGAIKSSKREGNTTGEGMVFLGISPDKTLGILLEVNCETDFVAKSEQFQAFVKQLGHYAVEQKIVAQNELMAASIGETTIESMLNELVVSLDEKIRVRRLVAMECVDGAIAGYLHGRKIGALVNVVAKDHALGEDIAMHVVAMKPICLTADDVPDALIKKERSIIESQIKQTNKPANILQQMVAGRLQKFINEMTLHGQPFAKEPKTKVADYLDKNDAEVLGFACITLGEGIEKKESDFAKEVADQLK